LKENLLSVIICPTCHTNFDLTIKSKINTEIITGFLKCKNKHKFLITGGIPRFVTDKQADFIKTEDAFSSKWEIFNKTYHDPVWISKQKKWFIERFGWKTAKNLNKFLKTKKFILDAGTGVGNSAKLFSTNKTSNVFAIDASSSINFAYKKYGKNKNIHFIQADLRNLPFKKNTFDFICSDQVLHHTKNTETSFKYLRKFLQKSGHISIYVYNKKGPMREFADNYIRNISVNMSEKECLEFSKDMANLGKTLSKLNKKIKIERDIPILNIKKGVYDIQRFFYWNFVKCWWSDDVPFSQSVATNYDWYSPKFAYRHTLEEVQKWFLQSNLKIKYFKEIESGISVTGKSSQIKSNQN
jgi:ubiquinone/menaquinone biosynthesis C-methylase UbiE